MIAGGRSGQGAGPEQIEEKRTFRGSGGAAEARMCG